MNVRELIEMLEDYDQEAEVMLVSQPQWPMAHHLAGLADESEMAGEKKCDEHDFYNCDECAEEAPNVVWLVEGDQRHDDPYGPRAAFDVARSY